MDSGLQTIKLSELPEAITLNESDYSLIVQNGTSKKIKGLLLKGNVGDNGKSIEIQKTDTHIQWRQEGGQWINLVALADLKGDKGEQGGGANVDLTDYATKVWVTQQLASYYTKAEIDLSLSNKANVSHVHNYNDLTNKPTIPTSTNQLNNDSGFITENEVGTAISSYVTAHKSELKGDKGDKGEAGVNGRDGANAVNPNFSIGTVTTLDAGSQATVTLTGTYPNLVLNFGIPRGADGSGGGTEEPVDTTPYMYYGRLSFQDVGGTNHVIPYSQITEAMIKKGVTDGKLTKETPKTMGKTSMGDARDTAAHDYIVIAVPASKNYKVTKDNGIGGKVRWDESTAGANGVDITINSVPCKLYGEMLISQGEYFMYVD